MFCRQFQIHVVEAWCLNTYPTRSKIRHLLLSYKCLFNHRDCIFYHFLASIDTNLLCKRKILTTSTYLDEFHHWILLQSNTHFALFKTKRFIHYSREFTSSLTSFILQMTFPQTMKVS